MHDVRASEAQRHREGGTRHEIHEDTKKTIFRVFVFFVACFFGNLFSLSLCVSEARV